MVIGILVIVLLIILISSIRKNNKRKDAELRMKIDEYKRKKMIDNKDHINPLTQ